jgi:nitrate reductase delta subunit
MLGDRRKRSQSATVYKLCSLLLSYPDAELVEARPLFLELIAELAAMPARASLERFASWWGEATPLALQQHYVETFDLDKRCGLYVTFYGEGDRRERGLALLRLKRLYRAAGLPLEGTELPDYLPVMLEFASAAANGQGALVLREQRAAIELLRESLHDRGTPYAHVLDAVTVTLGSISAGERARALAMAASGPPSETVGLEPFAPPEVMPKLEARR